MVSCILICVAALGGIARPKDGFAYSCPDMEESSFVNLYGPRECDCVKKA